MVRGRKTPPPASRLIQARRLAITPPMSMRRAAALAGISAQSWGNVERGWKAIGAGIEIPSEGSPDMIARMAYTVGVTPAELDEAAQQAADDEQAARVTEAARFLKMISTEKPSARAAETIKRAIDAIASASGLNDAQKDKLRRIVEQTVDQRAEQG